MFHDLLPFLIVGLVSGAVYGLAGTGLVLTYKTSGIFNFSYGSVAAVGVFIFYWLHTEHGMPWPFAALLTVCVLAPVEGLLLELLARAIERQGTAVKVVATIGILLIVLGIGTIWYGTQFLVFPQYLPQKTFEFGGVFIAWSQVIVFLIALFGAGALYYFFRYVRLGIAMKGVVDDPDLVAMTGESPARIRRLAWVIGTVFATVAGLLIAPSLGVDATVITLLIVQAFGAAAVGYFSSLPLTFVGGLVVGVASAFATKFTVDVSWLSGFPAGVPFILLFLVLIFTPARKLAQRRARQSLPVQRSWVAPTRARLFVGIIALALLAVVPVGLNWNINIWSSMLIAVILFLSIGLLLRTSGQISLCHYTFVAIGAAAFGHALSDWHLPWLVALLLAGIITIPVGALVAIPAIRLPGVFLAVATLGLAILVQNIFFTTHLMFGPTTAGVLTPGPKIKIGGLDLSTGNGYYYVVLAIALVVVIAIIALQRGRMGRLLAALGDSPTALEVHGTDVNVIRTLVFCISAGLAGIVGALTGSLYGYAVGSEFEWFGSVQIAVVVLIAVGGTPWYALLAAAGTTLVPGYFTNPNVGSYLYIVFGVSAILYAIQYGHALEFPMFMRRAASRLDRLLGGSGNPPVAFAARGGAHAKSEEAIALARHEALPDLAPAATRAVVPGRGLEINELSVNFGGVKAVVNVSLSAPEGFITGLVGPNGAGKTTTFNACSGLLRPATGQVLLHGQEITNTGRARRARLGLGRSFQRTELFDSLTVQENVAIGREAAMAGSNPLLQLGSKVGQSAVVQAAVEESLSLVGIENLANRQAGLLTTGQRRLVEFARLIAGDFTMVLLDEPSAGLDSEETERFGEMLKVVVERRGIGILLVEHDMGLVRRICTNIYVLDFGQLIFEGAPDEMMQSNVVRAAYLGGEMDGILLGQEEEVGDLI
jgi:ABC-type branched-subunit amino acid transport system ATPase component/branched-subunit amino acid ABC-type transport system permease component